MSGNIKFTLVLAFAALLSTSSAFAYNDSSARSDCLGKVVHWGSVYSNPHDVRSDETGYRSYNVSGLVNDRDGREYRFDCRVEDREVVSWNVNSGSSCYVPPYSRLFVASYSGVRQEECPTL